MLVTAKKYGRSLVSPPTSNAGAETGAGVTLAQGPAGEVAR